NPGSWIAMSVAQNGVGASTSAPTRSEVPSPATYVMGGTTSGSVHRISISGRSPGANRRTASIAGRVSSSTSAIVASASASDSARLDTKPYAVSSSAYGSKEMPVGGVGMVYQSDAPSGTRKYSPASTNTTTRQARGREGCAGALTSGCSSPITAAIGWSSSAAAGRRA